MRYAIVTDLNRCIGCHSCSVACKMENSVPIGEFYNKVLRIGPNPKKEGGQFPDVEMYFLPIGCQHCATPDCITVCPTQASYKEADGTVLVDRAKCIGCKLCIDACPYGVRFYKERENVVEKCTLCHHLISQGKEPMCVAQCVGQARVFGDLDDPDSAASKLLAEAGNDAHSLPDKGNQPMFRYILRNITWRT